MPLRGIFPVMDKRTTIGRLRELSRNSRQIRSWDPSAKNIAISINLEASELLENFQWDDWENRLKNKKIKEEIVHEVGDIIYYLCEFADKMEIDLSQSLKKTLKKIDRKFPPNLLIKHGDKFYYSQKDKYRKED